MDFLKSLDNRFDGYAAALRSLKLLSMRRGIWTRVLSRLERVQIDLTLKVVRKVRSPFLARILESIIEKLQLALGSRISRMINSLGFPMAKRLSVIAESWGNRSAAEWVNDHGFAKFLTVMTLSDSSLLMFVNQSRMVSSRDDCAYV